MFHKRRTNIYFLFPIILASFFGSCVTVKNYPGKAIVYSNKVNVDGNISKDEKKRLQAELLNYWHDSLKVRSISRYIGLNTLIRNPAVFDSSKISPSIVFMRSYLNSQGYYSASFKDSIDTVLKKNELRVNVVMDIALGKNLP